MTRFESEHWGIMSGQRRVKVFSWRGVRFSIAVCYDVESPRYANEIAKRNIDMIFVPSCTDDVHGYWRVRHCAEARAIETQSYVIVTSTVGGDPRFEEIYPNYGKATFLGPCDVGFHDDGCILDGNLNVEDIFVTSLDLAALKNVRRKGTVLNRLQLSELNK